MAKKSSDVSKWAAAKTAKAPVDTEKADRAAALGKAHPSLAGVARELAEKGKHHTVVIEKATGNLHVVANRDLSKVGAGYDQDQQAGQMARGRTEKAEIVSGKAERASAGAKDAGSHFDAACAHEEASIAQRAAGNIEKAREHNAKADAHHEKAGSGDGGGGGDDRARDDHGRFASK